MSSYLHALFRNLRSGLAMAAFRRVAPQRDFVVSGDQLAGLITLQILIQFGLDLFAAGYNPEFNFYAVPSWTFNQFVYIALLYITARLFKISRRFIRLLVITNSAVFLELLVLLSEHWLENNSEHPNLTLIVSIVIAIYGLAANFWLHYQASGLKRFACVCTLWLIGQGVFDQNYLQDYQKFWVDPYADSTENDHSQEDEWAAYRNIDAEALIYQQSQLLNAQLTKLKPQQKNRSELFFVGFAGYAMQDVFMKELEYAKHLMDSRFNTQGHSLNLINNLKTKDQQPLASATNLKHTLTKVGQLMDKQNDILVLYLTSHGSDDHHVSVSFWPMPFNDITPLKLKAFLDEAGIKWRVIVVSACYSGGFIDSLASPTTLIATAAAADKTSFGCSNTSEFTYYGEALFKQQLSQHHSLLEAFPKAVSAIEAREQQEGLEASHPQLSIGSEIHSKLAQWEKNQSPR